MAIHFVRHASSLYNIASAEWNPAEPKTIMWEERFIDTLLAPVGVEQATLAKERVAALAVDLVVVSPLRRALETCQILFGDRGVPIRVCPLFTEQLCHAPDMSAFLGQPFEEYSHFDWSELLGKDVCLAVKNDITARIQSESQSKSHAQTLMLATMRSMDPAYVESSEELTARVWAARAYLKKELDTGKRIAVVTHSYLIRELMKQLQGVGRVIDNCEVFTVDPSEI